MASSAHEQQPISLDGDRAVCATVAWLGSPDRAPFPSAGRSGLLCMLERPGDTAGSAAAVAGLCERLDTACRCWTRWSSIHGRPSSTAVRSLRPPPLASHSPPSRGSLARLPLAPWLLQPRAASRTPASPPSRSWSARPSSIVSGRRARSRPTRVGCLGRHMSPPSCLSDASRTPPTGPITGPHLRVSSRDSEPRGVHRTKSNNSFPCRSCHVILVCMYATRSVVFRDDDNVSSDIVRTIIHELLFGRLRTAAEAFASCAPTRA
jgi:hypothetical protein